MKSKRNAHSRKLIGVGIVMSGLCVGVLAFGQSRSTNSPTAAGSPDYDLTRYTIDAGGMMRSMGAAFELSGTIGQPDATQALAGGGYELTGGFWFALAPGDCNADGGVNLFDYDAFEACLSGPAGGGISEECACFDFDGRGTVDMSDFALIQQGFSGS